jgi:hypothetical protein
MTSSRRLVLLLVAGGAASLGACGDNGGDADARRNDASTIDADTTPDGDTTPDAAIASFSGTVAIAEASVQGIPSLGQGLTIDLDKSQDGLVPPVLEEMPASPLGCKVWQYTPAQAADQGLDEGAVQITVEDGGPVVPACGYLPTRGYLCRGVNGTGGTITPAGASTFALVQPAITNPSAEVGRYIVISGAATATNNGAFPIVGASSGIPASIVYANPNGAAEVLPAAATYLSLAGAGPIPGAADPGFLEDDDVVTVALTSGGDGDFESYTKTFTAAGGGIGDDFTLDTASQALITDLPVDGSAFSLGCAGAGGTCNTAIGSVLTITTTDSPTAGLPPYVLPPPTTMQVRIRCAAIGSGQIDVSAAASAFLMTSGATRVQASFLRGNLLTAGNTGPVPANTNIVAGHAIAGYSNP